WVLPWARGVWLSFQQGLFAPLITAGRYFAFAAQLIIAVAVVTELPLVIVSLAALGLVTPQFLARNRRYAIVISAVAAALLAPPDAVSMVLMMVPLWLLYEVGIWCAWVVERRRARRARAAGGAASAAGLAALLVLGGGALAAQTPPPFRPARADTTPRTAPDSAAQGRLRPATARRAAW